ncbi:MAG: SDR family NAD(P)-dependent oxidoreductase [Candidatus Staskawiczbacteria bacterium]|nr:SDR family NAD(P)-dependent oxidoreductase [Candidatus Staskawiczbacteria bacterium]
MLDSETKNILITGGAGFMGRWTAKNLVDKGHKVWILDNLSNSSENNIEEFKNKLQGFVIGDIKNKELLSNIFKNNFDICIHFAATINVQKSIDNPEESFNDNCLGFFNVLEQCRKHNTKIVFISSALVYETAGLNQKITEQYPLNPSCPYAAEKINGENIAISYLKTYKLPVVILRPFSIYGPYQRSDSEGGVMSIFINKKLKGQPLEIFGDGEQGRDFFYVEDCAEFIAKACFSGKAVGQVLNAGSGYETKIKDLAKKIAANTSEIKFIKHHHPHAEVQNMKADSSRAGKILNWKPKVSLEEGINKTTQWLKNQ